MLKKILKQIAIELLLKWLQKLGRNSLDTNFPQGVNPIKPTRTSKKKINHTSQTEIEI